MAFTQEQLDALTAAIAQGVRRVRYGVGSDQKEVEYPSLEDMLKLKEVMEQDLGLNTENKRFTLASHRRG